MEKLSEIATAILIEKEMRFPSFFKKLPREFTFPNAIRAVSFDYGGFSPERTLLTAWQLQPVSIINLVVHLDFLEV